MVFPFSSILNGWYEPAEVQYFMPIDLEYFYLWDFLSGEFVWRPQFSSLDDILEVILI